jgi:hypothetical protein
MISRRGTSVAFVLITPGLDTVGVGIVAPIVPARVRRKKQGKLLCSGV